MKGERKVVRPEPGNPESRVQSPQSRVKLYQVYGHWVQCVQLMEFQRSPRWRYSFTEPPKLQTVRKWVMLSGHLYCPKSKVNSMWKTHSKIHSRTLSELGHFCCPENLWISLDEFHLRWGSGMGYGVLSNLSSTCPTCPVPVQLSWYILGLFGQVGQVGQVV